MPASSARKAGYEGNRAFAGLVKVDLVGEAPMPVLETHLQHAGRIGRKALGQLAKPSACRIPKNRAGHAHRRAVAEMVRCVGAVETHDIDSEDHSTVRAKPGKLARRQGLAAPNVKLHREGCRAGQQQSRHHAHRR